ncbi:MAG: DUF1493 family protein [Bacteroidota bacterium]
MAKISNSLQEFIVEFCQKKMNYTHSIKDLNYRTKLEFDLGITGDDVDIFFIEFRDKFEVKMENFNARNYFGVESESSDVVWPIFRLIFGKKRSWIPLPREDRKPLTLLDLQNAINSGVWKV